MKERVDKLLVSRGLAPTWEKAQALIMAGRVTSGGHELLKPGLRLDEAAELTVKRPPPFVGRGGLKLAEALDEFRVGVAGKVALDIGASTGGFTDCLLKRGARKVFAVDVDTKQLDWGLRRDPRVTTIEKNARNLVAEDMGQPVDLIVVDVSFISLLKILPAMKELPGGWELLTLIKPQFEAGRGEVGDKGIVRDPGVHESVLTRIVTDAEAMGLRLRGLIPCSTRGQKGNIEFLALWTRGGRDRDEDVVQAWIKEAVRHETG